MTKLEEEKNHYLPLFTRVTDTLSCVFFTVGLQSDTEGQGGDDMERPIFVWFGADLIERMLSDFSPFSASSLLIKLLILIIFSGDLVSNNMLT